MENNKKVIRLICHGKQQQQSFSENDIKVIYKPSSDGSIWDCFLKYRKQLIGKAEIFFNGDNQEPYISIIRISKEFRGKGFGTIFIKKLIYFLTKKEQQKLDIEDLESLIDKTKNNKLFFTLKLEAWPIEVASASDFDNGNEDLKNKVRQEREKLVKFYQKIGFNLVENEDKEVKIMSMKISLKSPFKNNIF